VDLPHARPSVTRIAGLVVGAVLVAIAISADEPYKRMLDDPVTFSGTETLGLPGDLTEYRIGVFAPDGSDLARGVRLAVEQVNASGGVDGRPVRMVRRWAEDPWGAGSKEVIRMVFDDRVWALIGGPNSETTHVAEQVVTKAHLPLIAPASSDPSLTHAQVPWIFRLPPDDAAQADALVRTGIAPRKLAVVGIVVSADHDGRTFSKEITAAMERHGVPPAFEFAAHPNGDDSSELASRIRAFAPDGLVMRLEPGAARNALAALRTVGLDCPVFMPWVQSLRFEEFPPSYGGPVVQVVPFELPRHCGPYLKMVRASIRRDGEKPTPTMVYGFDAAMLVIEGLRRGAGGRIELRRRLAELSGFDGASGTIRWDNGGGNTARPVLETLAPREK
jgi:branched-chain amino acid transport system substrate-binding protein